MQRQSIESTRQLFEQGLELQQDATETFLHSSFITQRSARSQGAGLAREMANVQADAFESMFDETERAIRSAMDDQFERNAELTQQLLNDQFERNAKLTQQLLNDQFERNAKLTQQLLNDQFEQGSDFVQELLNAQVDAFGSVLEAGNFDVRGMIDEQFGAFADSRNDAGSEFEPEFLEALEDLTEQQQALVAESTEALLDVHRDFEERAISNVRRAKDAA